MNSHRFVAVSQIALAGNCPGGLLSWELSHGAFSGSKPKRISKQVPFHQKKQRERSSSLSLFPAFPFPQLCPSIGLQFLRRTHTEKIQTLNPLLRPSPKCIPQISPRPQCPDRLYLHLRQLCRILHFTIFHQTRAPRGIRNLPQPTYQTDPQDLQNVPQNRAAPVSQAVVPKYLSRH